MIWGLLKKKIELWLDVREKRETSRENEQPKPERYTMAYNPFGKTVSWIAMVIGAAETGYDPKADPRATEDDVSEREADRLALTVEDGDPESIPPLSIGDYLTDGEAAYTVETSVPNGKGSTVLKLAGSELSSVREALEGFNPESDLSKLPPAEAIRRTIGREDDGSITFKVSLAKSTRTVVVPPGEWDNFLEFVANLDDTRADGIEHYRNVTQAAEREAAEKAAKAAAAKANAPK